MAHVGDELRLVLARDFQLAALLGDLIEQARVLKRNRRLIGEALHEAHDIGWKLAGLAALQNKRAERLVAAEQWNDKCGAKAGFDRRVTQGIAWTFRNVRN